METVARRRWRLLAAMGIGLAFATGSGWGQTDRLHASDAEWIGENCPPVTTPSCPPQGRSPHVYPASPMRSPGFSPLPLNSPPSSNDFRQPGGLTQPNNPAQPNNLSQPESTIEPPVPNPPPANASDAGNTPNAANRDNSNNNFNNINASDFRSNFASTQSSFSAAPTLIGDFAGSGLAQFNGQIIAPFGGYAVGNGFPNPTFDISPGGGFNPDLIPSGLGRNESGDIFGTIDTYDLAEPLPLTDAPLAPGPGFLFQGGTIVYTNNATATTAQDGTPADGQLWRYDYAYARSLGVAGGGRPVPSPGVSVSRIKISENYSPEVRDRAFINYSFFNDFGGGLGDISRFVAGMERVLVDDLISLEVRFPVAATYGSRQDIDARETRSMEIGNMAFIGKALLFRTDEFLWSGGLGVSIPTADDTRLSMSGTEIVRVQNEAVQIQPFTSVLRRFGDWTAQAYTQLDLAAGGDPVLVNTDLANPMNGTLNEIGVFTDSTLMHLDLSLHCLLYQRQRPDSGINSMIANAELHYTTTLQDADLVGGNNFTYTSLQPNFNVVNATFGTHLVFGKKNDVIITPAMSIPLRDGLDEQFDYEALVQVNYLH